MMTNRVEFVVAVNGISKLGAAAVLLSPAWKAIEVDHAARAHRAGARGRRRRGRRAAHRAARAGGRHRPRRRRDLAPSLAERRRSSRRGRREPRPTRRCSCSARAPPAAQGGAPHPPLDRARHRTLGATRSGSAPTTGSRWPRRRRTSSGCSTCSPPRAAGATVRLHPRFDLDEVLRRIESDAHDPGDGGGADRPGDGQPPDARALRPLVAPLHHVGRHAGERERRRGGHRAHRRALAAGLRRQRAAGHRRQPRGRAGARGGSTPPACRPPASSCASSTSTPARSSPPGEIGEIQARARR